MQLQRDSAALRRAGLGLAAVSYDNPAVLAEFAKRKAITFPLLSDHDSAVIRAYGVADRKYRKGMQLDVEKEQVYVNSLGYVPVDGLSYPAVFVVGSDRKIKWRFVSEGSELRLTGAAILEQSVGGLADQSRTPVPSRNIQVTATASNVSAGLGNRLRIAVELKIPPGFHVYGPGVGGSYRSVTWKMQASDCLDIGEASYPEPEWKLMQSTGETLPVYEGTLRISREIIVKPLLRAGDPSVYNLFCERCLDAASRIKAAGLLSFQACDQRQCFPPQTVELQWKFQFLAPDRQRSSDALKREFEP